MMQYFIVGSLFILLSGCSSVKSNSDIGGQTSACGAGLLGTPPNCQPMLAGMCNSSSDCPAPYNNCDANNHCTIQPLSPLVWFATDTITPALNIDGTTGNGYIYNIMARGRQSLDDWCMSQAQQSTNPGLRNIRSWTALISSADITNNNQQRFNEYLAWQNYYGPKGQLPLTNIPAVGTSWVPVFDKNSNPINFEELLWSGFGQNGVSPSCVNNGTPWATNLYNAYTSTCAFYNLQGSNSYQNLQGLTCVDTSWQSGSYQCNCSDPCAPYSNCTQCDTCYDFSGIPPNNCNNSFRIMCLSAMDA